MATAALRRWLMISLGVLITGYASIVLFFVFTQPDIGLHTAFDTQVQKFTGLALEQPGTTPSDLPHENDRILSLGDKQVQTWPHLLQALNRLRSVRPVELDTPEGLGSSPATYVRIAGRSYVKLEYERTGPNGGDTARKTVWCRVGHLSAQEWIPSVLWFLLKLGLFSVGAFVFWNRPADRSAAQFYLLCVVTLGAYMGGYHWSRIAGERELIIVFITCSILLPAVLLHFYAVFPRPQTFFVNRPKLSLLLIYGVPSIFLVVITVTYFRVRALDQERTSIEAVASALSLLQKEIYCYLCVAAFWYLASVGCLWRSFRTVSDVMEHNQVKWIMFGSLVALLPIGVSLYLAVREPSAFSAGAATWPMFGASVCFTAAFVISITRYRLMQLDQLVTSGMIYFLISFLAAVVYYAVVIVGTLAVSSFSAPSLTQALSVVTTCLVLMLILDLGRNRLKRELDRRFHREKYLLDRTLRKMGRAIEQLIDPPTLGKHLLQASAEILSVVRGAIYLREGTPPIYRLVEVVGPAPGLTELSSGCPLIEAVPSRGAVVAHSGRVAIADPIQRQLAYLGGEVAQALMHENQLLGLLILGPKATGQYNAEDLNTLAAFAQLTGLAIKSAERHRTIESLSHELQAKVEKISEQQRRILALQSQLMRQSPAETDSLPPVSIQPSHGIVGSSPGVHELLQLVKKVSASQSAVLIRGESGTGKELLARAVHDHSPRAGKTFVKVHCAALSPGLLESELFGHVRGAFTGAHRDKIGRFELAHGGTLFLDEIGDISLEVQTKLLRVLQEMIFERVGSSEPVKVDVRIIAATHQPLEELISVGKFREDLYYRLNVISISVPPLRERREDIPELAMHFLRLHAERCRKTVASLGDDALAALKGYPWPGNIRQLENVLERAVVVAENSEIALEDLPLEIRANAVANFNGDSVLLNVQVPDPAHGPINGRLERDRKEREFLVRALAAAQGNKAEAARALGVARSTLVSRLKKHGLS